MMVKIRGISYSVETYGEGRPLVLLHGFTGSAESWHSFLGIFHSCKVILIDLIGHGRTDSPADYRRYSMEETVLDLHALFKELELDKPVLAGYSMGGRAALSYALRYPDTVSKLILESCTPGLLSSEERKKRRQSDKELAEMISEKGIPHFVQYWEEIPLFASQKSCLRPFRTGSAASGLKTRKPAWQTVFSEWGQAHSHLSGTAFLPCISLSFSYAESGMRSSADLQKR